MDWLTFISNIVSSLAWPLILIVVFISYKHEIISLVQSIKNFKAGEFLEIEFERKVDQLSNSENNQDTKLSIEELKEIEMSPRDVVQTSWLKVDQALVELAKSKNLLIGSTVPRYTINKLKEEKLISNEDAIAIHELKKLRNTSAHTIDFSPQISSIIEYKTMADNLCEKIKNNIIH